MADITITNENKNILTVVNENKPTTGTFADFAVPWADVTTTWAQPGTALVTESKNSLTIVNENK